MRVTQAGYKTKSALEWKLVLKRLEQLAEVECLPGGGALWQASQEKSLRWMAKRLREEPGVLIADEVGLGKTRLAVALAVCVAASGGRVAVLIPPGLAYQWQDEELKGFLKQLSTLQLDWLQEAPVHHFLRTYADLYGDQCSYPLADAYPILFISHGFGLPPVGKVVNPELWALPYLARKKTGTGTYGAGTLFVSPKQEEAAAYIGRHCSARLRGRLKEAVLGKPSPETFKNETLAELFQNLIGDLLGDFDLLIVDEAHKSRAGADLSLEEKKTEGKLRSRLTKLIDQILLARPRNRQAKRLALTATPMELGVDQWKTIFSRLGLDCNRVTELMGVVQTYADAVEGLRAGSDEEIERLRIAAKKFQKELQGVVTRRLWRDHPVVKLYSQATGLHNGAHPHRSYVQHSVDLERLGLHERRKLAVSEALAAAARGASVGQSLKTAGMRFSQALPQQPEATQDMGIGKEERSEKEKIEKKTKHKDPAIERAEQARLQRCAYWRAAALREEREQLGDELAAEPSYALQWHPRVRAGVQLIERLSGTTECEKVLVFGDYLASLQALHRSLNIRHFLRHMRDGKPIPLPQGIRAADPDMQRWRLDPEFEVSQMSGQQFDDKAAEFTLQYEREREQLRDVCGSVLRETGVISLLSQESARVLTTWLIQQFCVADQPLAADNPKERESMREAVSDRLASLPEDQDPPEGDEEQNITQKMSSWSRIVEQLKDDLQRNEAGEYVFRMNPFAQLMVGATKSAARRARQGTFNLSHLNPRVLLGQSKVMSEGLNLHRACRTVVLFHLDWNPGRIEQQIGRVDRQNSEWMEASQKALTNNNPPPKLEVYTLAVQGTYDELRASVVRERAEMLRAQLFGEILPPERLIQLPSTARERISKIHIDLRPDV